MSEEIINNRLSLVRIRKAELLTILKENLDKHNEIYNASTQAYYETLRAEFNTKVKDIKKLTALIKRKLKKVTTCEPNEGLYAFHSLLGIQTKKPTSYEDYYLAAIRKIEISIDETFALDDAEFQKYVLNNWEWSGQFISGATQYITGCMSLNSATGLALSGFLNDGIQKFYGGKK